MKKILSTILIATYLLLMACSTQKKVTNDSNKELNLMPQGPAWGALWQQRAAEYRALCFQAYNFARLNLDEMLRENTSHRPLAIVTDIDETVLDNSPFYIHQAINSANYTDSAWLEWSGKIACDTVPGAPSFFKYAAARGVTIFYITNRIMGEKDFTLQNLRKYHFPNADSSHLFLLTTTSVKTERRSAVSKNYDILMYCGDNLGDFSNPYNNKSMSARGKWTEENQKLFGKKYIALPNVMYGNWEDAYYDGKTEKNWADSNRMINKLMINY